MFSRSSNVPKKQNSAIDSDNSSDDNLLDEIIGDEEDPGEYEDNDSEQEESGSVARFLDEMNTDDVDDSDNLLGAEDDPLGPVNKAASILQKNNEKLSNDDDFFGRFKLPDTNNQLGTNRNGLGNNNPLKKAQTPNVEQPKKESVDIEDEDIPLYQWCEQFRYELAVEYVRLRRMFPKMYNGIQLAGWLEDLYEPVDEQDISARWGGGTFQLEAVQMTRGGAGRSMVTKKRLVTISGVPTHFVDDSGKPHQLPGTTQSNNNNNPYGNFSRREEQVLSRNRGIGRFKNDLSENSYGSYNSQGYNEPQKTANPPPQNITITSPQSTINPSAVFNSAAELFRLTQQQTENKKDDHKALEILRSAQNDVQSQMAEATRQQQEVYKEMLNSQRAELDRMRREQEALMEKAQKPLSEALTVVQSRADNEVLVLREQLRKAEKEKDEQFKYHLTQMDALRQEFRQKEHEIRQHAQLSSSENFQTIKMQMDAQRDNHQMQMAALQKESQTTISQLYQEINKLREDARERESKAREEAFKRESELKMAQIREISDLRSELNDRTTAVRTESDKRERELKSIYETREKDLRERFEEKERNFKEALEGKYANTIETLKEKLELLKSNSDDKVKAYMKDTDRREEQMKAMMETNFRSQLAIVEAEKNRLLSEVDALRREVDVARKERKEMTDPIAKLKEIRNFKETLQEFGFVSEPDPADKFVAQNNLALALKKDDDDDDDDEKEDRRREEAPKGFLGNLAKYGPQIAQNIIAPVLQRVDNATRLAGDALDNQKQELSQQAKLLEIQSKEMDQRRIKLEQESEMMKIQQAQALQQLQQRNALAEKRRRNLQDNRITQNGFDEFGRPLLNPNAIQDNPNIQAQLMGQDPRSGYMQAPMMERPQTLPPLMPQQVVQRPQVWGGNTAQVIPQINPADGRFIERPVTRETQPEMMNQPAQQKPTIRQPIDEAIMVDEQKVEQKTIKPIIKIQRQPAGVEPKEKSRVSALGQIAKQGFDNKKVEADIVQLDNEAINSNNVTLDTTSNVGEPTKIESQTPEVSPEVKKAFEELTTFIDQNYSQGVDVDVVSLQLSMAVATGRIPKDVFDTAIQGPFDNLYSNIKSISLEKGFKGLTTPRGLSYCQKIYKALNPNAVIKRKKKND